MFGSNDPKLAPVADRARGIAFGTLNAVIGSLGPVFANPFDGRIRGGWLSIDNPLGSITIRFWKKYKAYPTSADAINTAGIVCAATYMEFNVTPDFKTQVVRRGDVFAVEITALSNVIKFDGALFITPS